MLRNTLIRVGRLQRRMWARGVQPSRASVNGEGRASAHPGALWEAYLRNVCTKRIFASMRHLSYTNEHLIFASSSRRSLHVQLESRPIATKCITAGVLNATGDIASQFLVENASTLDLKRLAIFTIHSSLVVAPALHGWYNVLNYRLINGTGNRKAALRVAADQLMFAPVAIAGFLSILWTMEGKASEVPASLQREWPSVVVTNWKVWPRLAPLVAPAATTSKEELICAGLGSNAIHQLQPGPGEAAGSSR